MTWEKDNPFAVVDVEAAPPVVVARYENADQAEFHITHLAEHGGAVLAAKVVRGGYAIDGPEWVPVGTVVLYHDKRYTVEGYSDLSLRADLPAEEIALEYPGGEAYDLWPVGVPVKFGNRGQAFYYVRRKSFEIEEKA